MYTQYLEIKPSKIGQGLFTTRQIPVGVPITEFKGDIKTLDELPEDSSMYLQIGPNWFLAPTGTKEGADYINHSCDPNCTIHVVGNRAILYSLYVVPKNTELTFDYSTTSTDTYDMWKMNCQCGSYKCRRLISGFQYLKPDLQSDYTNKGMVPVFITQPNLIRKRQK